MHIQGVPNPVPTQRVPNSVPIQGVPNPFPIQGLPNPVPIQGIPNPVPIQGLPNPVPFWEFQSLTPGYCWEPSAMWALPLFRGPVMLSVPNPHHVFALFVHSVNNSPNKLMNTQ